MKVSKIVSPTDLVQVTSYEIARTDSGIQKVLLVGLVSKKDYIFQEMLRAPTEMTEGKILRKQKSVKSLR